MSLFESNIIYNIIYICSNRFLISVPGCVLSESTTFSCSNLEPRVMLSTPVLKNKDNKGNVKPELCLTSLRHSGNYPRSRLISESTYLQIIICLVMYLPMQMKPPLLGKMLETRIR